jgi:hypothetical protein
MGQGKGKMRINNKKEKMCGKGKIQKFKNPITNKKNK